MVKPRLCFVGPMVGRSGKRVSTQGEKLADLFRAAGYPVREVSEAQNRWIRLGDIIATLVRERRRIDLVVIFTYGGRAFVSADCASWIARRARLPTILSLHGGGLPELMTRYPRWTRRVLRRGRRIVVQSPFIGRAVTAQGFDPIVIPNLLELSHRHRLRQRVEPRIFWMRAFHAIYNPLLAVRAFGELRKTHPHATLVMAGPDMGLQAQVQALTRELNLDNAITFPGFLDAAGKRQHFDEADIFLHSNRVDNRPLSVVEAGACGLPVVATDVGGLRDLLTHEHTGLLVPPDDPRAMAAALRRLLEDASLAASLSANGKLLADASSPDRVQPQWERVIAEALA